MLLFFYFYIFEQECFRQDIAYGNSDQLKFVISKKTLFSPRGNSIEYLIFFFDCFNLFKGLYREWRKANTSDELFTTIFYVNLIDIYGGCFSISRANSDKLKPLRFITSATLIEVKRPSPVVA